MQRETTLSWLHFSPIFGPGGVSGQLHHYYLFYTFITIVITYWTINIAFIITHLLLQYYILLLLHLLLRDYYSLLYVLLHKYNFILSTHYYLLLQ